MTGADPHDIVSPDPTEPALDFPPNMPLLEGRGLVAGGSAAYVCRQFACEAPATRPEELARQLEKASTSSY